MSHSLCVWWVVKRSGGKWRVFRKGIKISHRKVFDSSCTSPVINRLFTHAHSCHSLPGHLISALTSLPRTRAASLTTERLPSAHWLEERRDGLMGEGNRDEDELAVPSCRGLLSVLACAALHPSYKAWWGENGKDPTERKKLPDYSVWFYLFRKRTNRRLPSDCRFNAYGRQIKAFSMKLLTVTLITADVHDGAYKK